MVANDFTQLSQENYTYTAWASLDSCITLNSNLMWYQNSNGLHAANADFERYVIVKISELKLTQIAPEVPPQANNTGCATPN